MDSWLSYVGLMSDTSDVVSALAPIVILGLGVVVAWSLISVALSMFGRSESPPGMGGGGSGGFQSHMSSRVGGGRSRLTSRSVQHQVRSTVQGAVTEHVERSQRTSRDREAKDHPGRFGYDGF